MIVVVIMMIGVVVQSINHRCIFFIYWYLDFWESSTRSVTCSGERGWRVVKSKTAIYLYSNSMLGNY
jgi:hypothetical protein